MVFNFKEREQYDELSEENINDEELKEKLEELNLEEFEIPEEWWTKSTLKTPNPIIRKKRIEAAEKIVSDKYALVVVAENIAAALEEVFSAQMDSPIPCIIVVPFTTEPTGFATAALAKSLKMATGINILQND